MLSSVHPLSGWHGTSGPAFQSSVHAAGKRDAFEDGGPSLRGVWASQGQPPPAQAAMAELGQWPGTVGGTTILGPKRADVELPSWAVSPPDHTGDSGPPSWGWGRPGEETPGEGAQRNLGGQRGPGGVRMAVPPSPH